MNSFFFFFRSILSTSFQFSICARKGKKLKTNNDLFFYAVTLQLSEFGAFHSMPNAGGQIKNRVQDKEDTDGEEIHCWEPNSTTASSIQTVLRHSSSAGKNCPAAFRTALFPGRRNVAFSHLVLVPVRVILAQTTLSCLLHIINNINLCHEKKNHIPNSSTLFVYFPSWSLLKTWLLASSNLFVQCV